ncbi:glycosyltransferase family 4 protein [Aliarcobacter cryaerophilus]|uniref:glycosyltransferase family 4 protein n=1 Tax=Aliarcobacter cryaerophilus TaxID=28198 RepID=UPI0021B3F082|nr:glycosyltransferase family 1 protein [Aliarcobacter cryaerophilus]MCT7506327.1 glycosyltransferase family 4 protein [Aliarcobacter cryaerophilus]
MNKIYLDCTHTYNSGLNTGIQRTVRNISSSIISNNYLNIYLVFYHKGSYYKFDEFPEVNIDSNRNKFKIVLKRIYKSIRDSFSIIPILNKAMLNPKLILFLNKFYDMAFKKNSVLNNEKVIIKKGDTLLIIDSAWSDMDFNHLRELKSCDVKIVPVVYDLIPISYPEYCSEDLVSLFNYWIKNILSISDKFFTISKDVKKSLLLHFKEIEEKRVDYFYLGCDFKNNSYDEKKINNDFKNIFNTKNVFITVSTIEPRKNHNYILDAFEKLWSKNVDVKYVIIGRIGWKVDDFISRVKNHKEYNSRLFLLENIDDEHLLYAYKNSKALIFASFIEGFGLPIIESLHNKLQVLASDIGVHREIGRDFVSYFNLNDINSLIKLIEDDNFNKNIDDFKWISWEESAKDLVEKVLKVE